MARKPVRNAKKDKKKSSSSNKKKEVAKREAGTDVAIPDYMREHAGVGLEGLSLEDYEVPRIQLIQSTSEQVEEYDAKIGNFWHTIEDVELEGPILFTPLHIDVRYILWRPRHDGGGILARADDGLTWSPTKGKFTVKPYKDNDRTVEWVIKSHLVKASGLAEWGSYDPEDSASQPAATKMYVIAAHLHDYPELSPCVITLQRSQVKVAQGLMSKINKATGSMPIWALKIQMDSESATNQHDQKYRAYTFKLDGFYDDEDLFFKLKGMYDAFERMGVKIRDEESMQDDDPEIGDDEGSDGDDEDEGRY